MATEFIINTAAHPNIYNGESRDFNVYYCLPDAGVTKDTGIVLLIAGYGGSASSNVYRKMRLQFADQYNLIAIQCDYFGSEFMQNEVSYSLDNRIFQHFSKQELDALVQLLNAGQQEDFYKQVAKLAVKYNVPIVGKACMNESLSNFNDMGLMQAIDNITAAYFVINLLKKENQNFNTKKIIAYGHSHGAYLSYLCNALVPKLFSLIIDNSAWLYPVYLQKLREIISPDTKPQLNIYFNYLVNQMEKDEELLNLVYLYELIPNYAKVIVFQGASDSLILPRHKERFCALHHFDYHLIDEEEVDGAIFKSTSHGLNADFLKLFDYVMTRQHKEFSTGGTLDWQPHNFQTGNYIYYTKFVNEMPCIEKLK